MFCPNCKSEYETGYTVCSECNVDLVEELQIPIKKGKSLSNRYFFFFIIDLLLGIIGGIFLCIAFGVMITNGHPGPYPPGDDTLWLVLIGLYIAFMSFFNIRGTIIYCKKVETKFFSTKGISRFLLTILILLVCIVIGFYLMWRVTVLAL